jgi:hypothetical protein
MDEILERLGQIEARLAALEENSHPPVDLTVPAYRAMARVLRDAAKRADDIAA